MNSKISVVIPSYNEEKNVGLLYDELKKVFANHLSIYDYELIYVNDGSRDSTWERIVALASKDKNVRGINFSRNFGHACALQAGMEKADGDAVISLDADLQHPPSLIPKLVQKWEEGYEIVATIRKTSEGASLFKRLSAHLFYKLINSLSSLKLRDGEADFRLIDRKVLRVINSLPEQPKFYRGLVNWVGYKKFNIEYDAVSRRYGTSSYTLKKMFELARMGLTSFSLRPLKLILAAGLTIVAVSALALFASIIIKIFINDSYVTNLAIVSLIILLMLGFSIAVQGVLAIYLIDIFNASKNRPSFIVREKINL